MTRDRNQADLVPINQAARLFPGRRPHVSTLWRWAQRGVRGVKLVIVRVGGRADESLQQLLLIMSTPPAWAAGFPIEVEGFYAERYYKSPPAGSRSVRARQGLILPPE